MKVRERERGPEPVLVLVPELVPEPEPEPEPELVLVPVLVLVLVLVPVLVPVPVQGPVQEPVRGPERALVQHHRRTRQYPPTRPIGRWTRDRHPRSTTCYGRRAHCAPPACRSWHRRWRTTIREGMCQPMGLAPEMAMASELVPVLVPVLVLVLVLVPVQVPVQVPGPEQVPVRAKATLRLRKPPCPPTVPIVQRPVYCPWSTNCCGSCGRCS